MAQKNQSKNNNEPVELLVEPRDAGCRLDVFCATYIESLSRNQIQKTNEVGGITVDGARRPHHYLLHVGERVRVLPPEPIDPAELPGPERIPLGVTFEDEHIIVINKPADLVVHPAQGNRQGTVVNAVLGMGATLASLGGRERPGVVHRLDKDTSGLMVMAKTDQAYSGLTAQLKERRFKKTYHAIVWGNLGVKRRTIDSPIARHRIHRQRMAVDTKRGRDAMTEVLVVDSFEYFDYIRVITFTGRTHQIRVHLEHISHPILGDAVYGTRRKPPSSNARVRSFVATLAKVMQRQALHASKLGFDHPVTGRSLSFRAALPDDIWLSLEMLYRNDRMQGGNR